MAEMTKNGKDTWKSTIELARDHFDKGFKELGKAAVQAKSQGRDSWLAARERLEEAWEDIRAKGLERLDQSRERGEAWVENSREYVSRNPMRAVGYSALAGLIIGLLMFSNREREVH
jgi:ElaB/YqjD/DUF883 family membrane-anchored ribosome-binding protein